MVEHIPEYWLPILKDIVSAVVIVVVGLVLYLITNRILKLAVARETLSDPVAAVFRVGIRWAVFCVTLLMVLQQFGILQNAWTALLTVMAMVAVGFVAVWSVLSNSLCTLLILIYRPYRVGDHVEIPADKLGGKVIDLNLIFTTLREENGSLIQVPNNTFFQKPFRRISGEPTIELYDQLIKKEWTE